jgi:nicotinic acid mononucleotide adenylyltransferase
MLPKTVVGFSVSDIEFYWQMLAWRGKEGIDFDFYDCRLDAETDRKDEERIKAKVRQQIGTSENYALLIGEDTWYRYEYVHWEAEAAIEKGCKIICVNLNGARQIVESKCPTAIMNIGAIFVPFSPRILAYALINFRKREQGNWHFPEDVYQQLETPV